MRGLRALLWLGFALSITTPMARSQATGGQVSLSSPQIQQTITYQPGLIAAVANTKSAFSKFVKTSTVDNIEVSAAALSCTTNPTITLYECGTDPTCATPTTIGSATLTTAGTVVDGTITSAAITAGHYVAWAISAGACTVLDIASTAQVHAN